MVSFCSDLYCGSISDPEIVKQSGYLQHLNRGDLVMADKGFTFKMNLLQLVLSLLYHISLKERNNSQKKNQSTTKKLQAYGFMLNDIWRDLKTGISLTGLSQ